MNTLRQYLRGIPSVMNSKTPIVLLFFAFCLYSTQAVAQNVFARKNLTSVSVDKLGEDEILLFKQSFESRNLTPSAALRDLGKRGMSEMELRKLKLRLGQIGHLDPEEQAQMLTMRLMQLQDSLQNAQGMSAQLSGLERLYAMDSLVFGAELFRSKTLDFAPNMTLATPPSYILGNGDILSITIYGYQELNVDVAVKPDGTVNIPYSGVVSVSGLSMKEAKARIKKRLSANGYNTLLNGSSEISLSLKEIRSVDVTVIGAKVPGRYTVPGVASPYHLLHLAGGPAAMGSYRQIYHMRNGEIVGTIDIYELMGTGLKNDDLRLEDGDVVFIPPHSGRIFMDGEFKKPRIFEMKPGEFFEDIFSLAGGFNERAYKEKVFVERVTKTGFSTQVITPDEFSQFTLRPGDHFIADTLNNRFRNRISVAGGVQSPGFYGLGDDRMTLYELVQLAGGFREDGDRSMAVVSKKDSTGNRMYISLKGDNWSDYILEEGDSVLFPTKGYFLQKEFVHLSGEVRNSGDLIWAEGLTVWDAILLGGGFTQDADQQNIEFSHRKDNRSYSIQKVDVQLAKTTLLEPGDLVAVKRTRIRNQAPSVVFKGEVVIQGAYALESPFQEFKQILSKAGGLTPYADVYAVYVIRQSRLALKDSVNSGKKDVFLYRGEYFSYDTIAMSNQAVKGRTPFILEANDQVFFPSASTTVHISGEVQEPKTISFTGTQTFNALIRESGGITSEGSSRRAYVRYPNGISKSTRNFLIWKIRPRLVPGAEIVVPMKPLRSQEGWSIAELSVFTSSLASVSTMAIAIVQLLRP